MQNHRKNFHPFQSYLSGTLSKRPSVARRMTSPSSTLNSYWSADSGLSASTWLWSSVGGRESWNGVLK